MKFQEQLPLTAQNYLSPTSNHGTNRKHFGSAMAKSVIFPSSGDQNKMDFKKLAVLKTNNKIGGLTFKNEKSKTPETNIESHGNMYKSMMISQSDSTGCGFDSYSNNKLSFEATYPKNSPTLSKPSDIDQIINRHKSQTYSMPSTPLLDSYLKSSSPSAYQSSFTSSYQQAVGTQYISVNDYKKRDNLYGCFDPYQRISDYKSYETYNYTPLKTFSNTYNFCNTNLYPLDKYQGQKFDFSKKKHADYTNFTNVDNTQNTFSTIDYSPIDKIQRGSSTNHNNNYSSMSNAERIFHANNSFGYNIKESDFKIGKKLGKGQFGEVFLVQHKLTGFVCALKIIPKTIIKEEKVEQQLVRQIKIQFYLRSNNLVALYGFFSDYSNVYLLMELCIDGHVFDILRKRRRVEQPQVRDIVKDICVGLEYVHSQRIIHRDIKPENVILQFGVAKLCDFGWSVYRGTGLRSTFCGTPLYTSPQLIRGEKYDQKIDIWAIGVLTYELLIGKIPFKIYSQDDLNRILQDKITFPEFVEISYDAKDFILKTLDRSPGGTYLTVDMLLSHPFLKTTLKQNVLFDVTLF